VVPCRSPPSLENESSWVSYILRAFQFFQFPPPLLGLPLFLHCSAAERAFSWSQMTARPLGFERSSYMILHRLCSPLCVLFSPQSFSPSTPLSFLFSKYDRHLRTPSAINIFEPHIQGMFPVWALSSFPVTSEPTPLFHWVSRLSSFFFFLFSNSVTRLSPSFLQRYSPCAVRGCSVPFFSFFFFFS